MIILWRKLVQAFLNDMIAIEILNEDHDVQAQRNNDGVDLHIVSKISLLPLARKQYRERAGTGTQTCLALSGEEVDHLLDRAGAVHVQRDVDEFLCDGLADDVPLLVRRVLKQLLAEVVPEGI